MRRPLAALLILSLTSGCATMHHGAYERIAVRSEPAGALVGVDCGDAPHHARTVTPATVRVPRAAEKCRLLISKAGYESQRVDLQRRYADHLGDNFKVAGAGLHMLGEASCCDDGIEVALSLGTIVGGLLIGGVGSGVDAATGAIYEHTPQQVSVRLAPAPDAVDEEQ